MIVRIQGEGQYELDDQWRADLDKADADLFKALGDNDRDGFLSALKNVISYVESHGSDGSGRPVDLF